MGVLLWRVLLPLLRLAATVLLYGFEYSKIYNDFEAKHKVTTVNSSSVHFKGRDRIYYPVEKRNGNGDFCIHIFCLCRSGLGRSNILFFFIWFLLRKLRISL